MEAVPEILRVMSEPVSIETMQPSLLAENDVVFQYTI